MDHMDKYSMKVKEEGISDKKADINGERKALSDSSKFTENANIDFNKLYGELYQRLLNTPATDIFPQGLLAQSPTQVTSPVCTGNTSPQSVHPAFPFYGACAEPPTKRRKSSSQNPFLHYGTNYHGSPGMPGAILHDPGGNKATVGNADEEHSPLAKLQNIKPEAMEERLAALYSGDEKAYDEQQSKESIDVQKLVDEFRVTLEKYGVSQRFAARFIMQDTSQGNLSFLMEKGRNKRWEELSPRGRIPYIKMKQWLESSEQQMLTLEMLKRSQEMKKAGPRETYSRRERFSMFQLQVLCRLFEENPNPAMNIRNAVATRLNIPLDRVNVWFQNQRARGFPAKKILQQSYLSDAESSATNDMSSRLDIPQIESWMKRELFDYGNIDTGKFDYYSASNDSNNTISQPSTSRPSIAAEPILEQHHNVTSSPVTSNLRSPDTKSYMPQPLDLSAGGSAASRRNDIDCADADKNCSSPLSLAKTDSDSINIKSVNGASSDTGNGVPSNDGYSSPLCSNQIEPHSDSRTKHQGAYLVNGSSAIMDQSATANQNLNTSGSQSGNCSGPEVTDNIDQSVLSPKTALELELKASQSGAAKRKRGIKLHQLMQMRNYANNLN